MTTFLASCVTFDTSLTEPHFSYLQKDYSYLYDHGKESIYVKRANQTAQRLAHSRWVLNTQSITTWEKPLSLFVIISILSSCKMFWKKQGIIYLRLAL